MYGHKLMSKVNTDAIKPRDTGLDITLGATGDTTVISADSINTNTVKDSGGNTLWTSDGSGTLSNLNSGGAETLILSQTLSTVGSDDNLCHFTNGVVFDSTYDHYKFGDVININQYCMRRRQLWKVVSMEVQIVVIIRIF